MILMFKDKSKKKLFLSQLETTENFKNQAKEFYNDNLIVPIDHHEVYIRDLKKILTNLEMYYMLIDSKKQRLLIRRSKKNVYYFKAWSIECKGVFAGENEYHPNTVLARHFSECDIVVYVNDMKLF